MNWLRAWLSSLSPAELRRSRFACDEAERDQRRVTPCDSAEQVLRKKVGSGR